MKILLSIRPEFVDKIFDRTKRYEFRKSLFKRNDVTRVIIYASSPIKRIVGEFEIESILSGDVDSIWEQTKHYSGITKEFYYSYFHKKKTANAIKIGKIIKYKKAKDLSFYHINQAPQSFCYIS